MGTDASWDATRDADGSAASGSARASSISTQAGQGANIVSQCIPLLEVGKPYLFGAKAFIPAGQAGSGGVSFSLGFYPEPSCSGPPIPGAGLFLTQLITTTNQWTPLLAPITAVSRSARLFAYTQALSPGSFTANVDDFLLEPAPATSCAGEVDANTLCLNGVRFKVTATYDAGGGNAGTAHAVPLTSDSGYLWFFAASNVEAVVKVIDGCNLGGHFWFFAGGLTNVKTVITVTDMQTGAVKTYTNPQGQAFAPIQDTSAFACP